MTDRIGGFGKSLTMRERLLKGQVKSPLQGLAS